jgi:hypothetical protein
MPDELIPNQNTGVLLGSGTKQLWVGGTIPYEVRLESGDWRPYLPVAEKQKNPVETMACVTFSDLNVLEIQAKQQSGIEPNWSDRFIAKLSDTTPQGNYLDKVADTVRKFGLVQESDWPTPPNATWTTYYADIPQQVINRATKVDIAYEGIVASESELRHHLKQCPLQIIILKDDPTHAVTLVALEGKTAYYFDSYSPFLKEVHVSLIHPDALKIVLKGNMTNAYVVKNGSEYAVAQPATSEDGLVTLLRSHGLPTPLKPDGKLDFAEVDKFTKVI